MMAAASIMVFYSPVTTLLVRMIIHNLATVVELPVYQIPDNHDRLQQALDIARFITYSYMCQQNIKQNFRISWKCYLYRE